MKRALMAAMASVVMLTACSADRSAELVRSNAEVEALLGYALAVRAERPVDQDTANLCVTPYARTIQGLIDRERGRLDSQRMDAETLQGLERDLRRGVGTTARVVRECGTARGYARFELVAASKADLRNPALDVPAADHVVRAARAFNTHRAVDQEAREDSTGVMGTGVLLGAVLIIGGAATLAVIAGDALSGHGR